MKTKIIFFLILITWVLTVNGQGLNISIVKNSICFRNNNIYLKFTIKNESNRTYVLYNLYDSQFASVNLDDSLINKSLKSEVYIPFLNLMVTNKKNKFFIYRNYESGPFYL